MQIYVKTLKNNNMYTKIDIEVEEVINSLDFYDKIELIKDLSSNYLNCKELIDIAINNYSTEEVLDNIDDKDIVEYLNSIKNIK